MQRKIGLKMSLKTCSHHDILVKIYTEKSKMNLILDKFG